MKQTVHSRLQRYWDIRATGNFAFGGAGAGVLIIAYLAQLFGQEVWWPTFAGLALIGAGLLCVWMEIGKPWRALNVIFHPHTSWMTREALVAAPLMLAGAVALFVDMRFLIVVAILAAAFLYCQARILLASRGIPAWCQKEIVPVTLATGIAEGAGLFLLMGPALRIIVAVALAAAILREITRELYRRALHRNRAPQGTLRWFALPEEQAFTVARFAAIVLLAAALAGLPTAAIGGLLALIGGWAFKYMLVNRAAFLRGHIIAHTPARGNDQAHVVAPR